MMSVPTKSGSKTVPVLYVLIPIILCLGLCAGCQALGTQYYQRDSELRRNLKLGMTRTEVYRELDEFWPHTIWRADKPSLCGATYPHTYFKEVANFYGPFGLGPLLSAIVMCFDESGKLVFIK